MTEVVQPEEEERVVVVVVVGIYNYAYSVIFKLLHEIREILFRSKNDRCERNLSLSLSMWL
jgi:hypothetical protein